MVELQQKQFWSLVLEILEFKLQQTYSRSVSMTAEIRNHFYLKKIELVQLSNRKIEDT